MADVVAGAKSKLAGGNHLVSKALYSLSLALAAVIASIRGKFGTVVVLWPYVWLYSVFKSCSRIFGYIDRFWSYGGYMVESGELVILWSYEIGGRGKWEFGQIVGYM